MNTLRDMGEFGWIRRLTQLIPTAPAVVEGIGDDCAVLRLGDRLMLVSCDLLVEGVHFRREHSTAQDIGWKAAASSLSDIAAMGGTPMFCLISLACPSNCEVSYLDGVYHGLSDAVSQCGAAIVGGDTTRSEEKILLDVTVIGEVIGNRYISRRGAQAGDLLCVTGWPGRAASGLWALEHNVSAPPILVQAFNRPEARLAEGLWLGGCSNTRCMIDISDGLVQDAGHLVENGYLGIDLDPEKLPVHPDLERFCEDNGLNPFDFVLAGGEDYELLFALRDTDIEHCLAAYKREFRTPIHIIGTFTDAWRGVKVGGETPARAGFDHFKS